jgi:hypothetical protein
MDAKPRKFDLFHPDYQWWLDTLRFELRHQGLTEDYQVGVTIDMLVDLGFTLTPPEDKLGYLRARARAKREKES